MKLINADLLKCFIPKGADEETWNTFVDEIPPVDIRELAKDEIDNAYMHGYTEAESKYREIISEMREGDDD